MFKDIKAALQAGLATAKTSLETSANEAKRQKALRTLVELVGTEAALEQAHTAILEAQNVPENIREISDNDAE